MTSKKKKKMSMTTQIALGLILGILCGLFFGEKVGFMKSAADAFVMLLQMTVLPYITVSLLAGLGALTFRDARTLAVKGGLLMLLFWALTFGLIFLAPLTFPVWKTASFFSTALIEEARAFDFLSLYIPANPFQALSGNMVPAVVLFCVLLGVALIGIERKEKLLDVLVVLRNALSRLTSLVVKLTPLGIFAITAHAAGTMSVEILGKLQVYLLAYTSLSLFLTFWVLPGLVNHLTGMRYRDVVGLTRDALITAFMTGNLLVVLSILIEQSKEILRKNHLDRDGSENLVDVIVPAVFNFPNAGKLLMLLFILFAGWFTGDRLSPAQYPALAAVGLFSFFGSVNVAVPFLLDFLRIPADLFQLFLVMTVVQARFATLLAAMHLLVFALLGTCAISGTLRITPKRIIRYAAVTAALTFLILAGLRLYFTYAVRNEYQKDRIIAEMQLLREQVPEKVYTDPPPPLPDPDPRKLRLDRIRERGFIRVGYNGNILPYAYFNAAGDLVGFDVEMAHRLAKELGVGLECVPVELEGLAERLEENYCDIVMSGFAVTTDWAQKVAFSDAYLDETIAFFVRDFRRDEFNSREAVQSIEKLKIGGVNLPYYVNKLRGYLPQAEVKFYPNLKAFLEDPGDTDAFLTTAERASAWSLLHPEYTVAIPHPDHLTVPVAYPMARGDADMVNFVNTWLDLKKKDGTVQALYDHWILGKTAEKKAPRWCVIRDVLGWVE